MPWGSWQFWVVTAAAAGALIALIRVLIPRRTRGVRTPLTVERHKPKG